MNVVRAVAEGAPAGVAPKDLPDPFPAWRRAEQAA
jgi:hypothetical protein